MYAQANKMMILDPPNFGLWEKPVGYLIKPTDSNAYWGVLYLPMVTKLDASSSKNVEANQKRARSLWRCPFQHSHG